MILEISRQLLSEANITAVKLVQSGCSILDIGSTGFYVTVEPENRVVIHKFECEGVKCYITMGR